MSIIDIPGVPFRVVKPTEGAPTGDLPGADSLVGVDSNAFGIMAHVDKALKRAGASQSYRDAYMADARSGDYDRLLQVSMAYLTDGSGDEPAPERPPLGVRVALSAAQLADAGVPDDMDESALSDIIDDFLRTYAIELREAVGQWVDEHGDGS